MDVDVDQESEAEEEEALPEGAEDNRWLFSEGEDEVTVEDEEEFVTIATYNVIIVMNMALQSRLQCRCAVL